VGRENSFAAMQEEASISKFQETNSTFGSDLGSQTTLYLKSCSFRKAVIEEGAN
jgi:hypothetical protein